MDSVLKNKLDAIHRLMVRFYGKDFFTADKKGNNSERRHIFYWVVFRIVPRVRLVQIAEYMGITHCSVRYGICNTRDKRKIYKSFKDESDRVYNYVVSLMMEDEALGLLAQPDYEI